MRRVILKKRSKISILVLLAVILHLGLCLGGIGCSSDDGPQASSGTSDPLSQIEQSVHDKINLYRSGQGLPVLVWDETIADVCRTHSLNMASGQTPFGHTGFDQRIDEIGQTITYTAAAENVAQNNYPDPAETAVAGWLNSPGHLTNIEGDYTLTGVGAAQSDSGVYYFTQIFIRQ